MAPPAPRLAKTAAAPAAVLPVPPTARLPTSVLSLTLAGPWGPPLLPGEQPAAAGYTRLTREVVWLTRPQDVGPVLARVKAFREMALHHQASRAARRAWVVWAFWGLTRVFYPLPSGGLGEGRFFRERLERHNTLVPILRLVCQFGGQPKGPFEWRAQTHSHWWSFYSSRYDRKRRRWVEKEDVAAPEHNAKLLAQALGLWLLRFPGASFSWDVEREHSPDLTGCVPEMLGQLVGHRRVRLEVAAIRGLRRGANGRAE